MSADTTGAATVDPFATILGIIGGVGFDAAMTAIVIWGVWAVLTGRIVSRREHADVQTERDNLRQLVRQREATIAELLVAAQAARGMFAALPEAASVVRDETIP